MVLADLSFDLASLRRAYLARALSPAELVPEIVRRIGHDPHHAWIEVASTEALLEAARRLEARDPATLPLYGIPIAVKDNIDVAGFPTTAGCPAYAYRPTATAPVVARLEAAGALVVGKTNLDQFATGLNGTRSPFGACLNAFDGRYVSGGSSSGSAVAVALGQVSLALGTDTAGSGRVPAGFNHIVGLKPSLGRLSTRGVVPACRTLDAVSIFALTATDAAAALAIAQGYDALDPFSRPAEPARRQLGRMAPLRIGVPKQADREFFGNDAYRAAFEAALEAVQRMHAEIVPIDFAPFAEVARLLYEGPWVAERYEAIRGFITTQPDALHPVTRTITLSGARPLAADAFAAHYRLKALKRTTDAVWSDIDLLLVPTAPTHPTIEAMLAEPIVRNSELGYYTNFVNLLDYAAIAMPATLLAHGLPFGITAIAPAHSDEPLLEWAARWQAQLTGPAASLGATGRSGLPAPARATGCPAGWTRIAVCGAHLQGEPLNGQLIERGADLVAATVTAPHYRLYALPDGLRPGLVRVEAAGAAIEVEVWELPVTALGSFLLGVAAPLAIGRVELADGTLVPGFICEAAGVVHAADITSYGGWRAYRSARAPSAAPPRSNNDSLSSSPPL